jgi:hypothetical protein
VSALAAEIDTIRKDGAAVPESPITRVDRGAYRAARPTASGGAGQ